MATHNPNPDSSIDLRLTLGPVDDDDVVKHVESPIELPGGVRQVNATISHPPSGRMIRRMILYDPDEERATDTEVGLVDGEEVYQREAGKIRYLSAGLVYVDGLSEAMPLEDYASMAGFDEPGYRLGPGFESAVRECNGLLAE